jgi:hypothetical protein
MGDLVEGGSAEAAPLTFDREAAKEDRSLASITPVHPPTQAAARAFARDEELPVTLRVNDPSLPVGDHPFAIYQWQMRGLRGDAMLVPVVEDTVGGAVFMDIFASAADASDVAFPDSMTIEGLKSWHHELWARRRCVCCGGCRDSALSAR